MGPKTGTSGASAGKWRVSGRNDHALNIAGSGLGARGSGLGARGSRLTAHGSQAVDGHEIEGRGGQSLVAGRRSALALEAERRWRERRARLAQHIRTMRKRRRWTQQELADRAGVHRLVVTRLERGEGRFDLEVLERLAISLGVPLAVAFGRDPREEEVADAGHLAMQELVLGRTRDAGWVGRFELATRQGEPWRSIDVGLGRDESREAVVAECWNTFGDLGAASRSSTRKQAEMQAMATARWGEEACAGLVWIVRDTDRNHRLVARYPEVFASRFPGSSRAWINALTHGGPMPREPGLVWCDVGRGRLHAWRKLGRDT